MRQQWPSPASGHGVCHQSGDSEDTGGHCGALCQLGGGGHNLAPVDLGVPIGTSVAVSP